MRLYLLLILFTFLTISQAKVVIATNQDSDITKLSKESIKYLYLAKVNKINDIKIKPLLSKDKILHEKFVNNIIDKDISQYRSYWARLVFTGRKPIPRRLDKEEINKALNQLNTIIYIDKENIHKNWKIVYEN
jgi:hypothetical protein